MNVLYAYAGISKQAHQQWRIDQLQRDCDDEQVIAQIRQQRLLHPRMGLRKLHGLLALESGIDVGRDRFIAVAMAAGLGVDRAVNRRRTTYGVNSRYRNLLVGTTLTDVNQVWVSDITYYWVGRGFSYLTLLMDLYSRKIVGACAAQSLHAHWSVATLKQALIARQIHSETRLIHHSDRGSQYLSKDYLEVLAQRQVAVSTCEIVYENAHAERVNGIIKQEYLDAWRIDSHRALLESLPIAIERYNTGRPHGRLANRTPEAFEEYLTRLPIAEHPPMPIWPQQPLVNLTEGVTVPYILK
jgi:transposase InsO family protein